KDSIQRDPIMTKNLLLAVALLSLALAAGCAKGGNGVVTPIPTITVSDGNLAAIYPNQTVTFTATVGMPPEPASVTWSLSGSSCSPLSLCGTLDSTTGVYTAPASLPCSPSPCPITITATSTNNSADPGSLPVSLTLISAVVTPLTVNVGQNLVQQFTAIAVPDDAPQTFTWSQPTCTNGTNCGTISYDPNSSGVAVYTAGDVNQSVVVAATSTVSPSGVAQAKVAVVTSRLPSGTYAFQFSGYDPSNNPVAAAGSFILTSSGIIRMIESDGLGTGSGVLQESAKNTVFNAGAQNFVFGFTGVNKATGGTRVGYIGLLPLNGTSGITGGLVDANDYPNVTPICSSPPCSIASNSSYSQPNAANLPTWWEMTLITAAGTQHFDFFVSAGQTSNQTNPLTLYAISTDPIDATHPALSGSMAYQWPGTSKSPITYNNAGFNGTSVSNLTGTNANVSLTLGRTDGTSGGSGGTGGFTGNFDWNNDGTIVSVDPTPSDTTIHFTYTYVATPINSTQYVG